LRTTIGETNFNTKDIPIEKVRILMTQQLRMGQRVTKPLADSVEPKRLRGESEEQYIEKLQVKRMEIVKQNAQLEKEITEITKRIIQNELDGKRRTIHSGNLSSHTTASTVGSTVTASSVEEIPITFESSGVYASENPKFAGRVASTNE
jgi:hypothetical protein